jgi:hypothetical protein
MEGGLFRKGNTLKNSAHVEAIQCCTHVGLIITVLYHFRAHRVASGVYQPNLTVRVSNIDQHQTSGPDAHLTSTSCIPKVHTDCLTDCVVLRSAL